KSGLPNNTVTSLLENILPDGSRILWVGTYGGGLAKLQNGQWTTFNTESGLPSNNVWCLLETKATDGSSILWVGTEGGLTRLQNEQWTTYDTKSGLPGNDVWCLLESRSTDGGSTLWAGTNGSGVARLDLNSKNAVWEKLSDFTRSALPDIIYQIRQDAKHRI